MQRTDISWTDATWNPVRGCSRVSPGCEHCYAEAAAARFGNVNPFHGFAEMTSSGPRWTRVVKPMPHKLVEPLRDHTPKKVFVNSMSDLFHEALPFEYVAAVFGIMAAAPWHTFQVLTKRPKRMREFFEWIDDARSRLETTEIQICIGHAIISRTNLPKPPSGWGLKSFGREWPLSNVWLGVSIEDNKRADERLLDLILAPAAIRFVSCEPLLGPIDLTFEISEEAIDWVIVGAESGPRARPCEIGWIEDICDECQRADVPVFVKQDYGPKPDRKGRIPDRLWKLKQFPRVEVSGDAGAHGNSATGNDPAGPNVPGGAVFS